MDPFYITLTSAIRQSSRNRKNRDNFVALEVFADSTANIAVDIPFVKVFDTGWPALHGQPFLCLRISCILAVLAVWLRLKKIQVSRKLALFDFVLLKKIMVTAIPRILQQSSISNFSAQNIGTHQYGRIKEGSADALLTGRQFLWILSPFHFVISAKLVTDGILRGIWYADPSAGQSLRHVPPSFTAGSAEISLFCYMLQIALFLNNYSLIEITFYYKYFYRQTH